MANIVDSIKELIVPSLLSKAADMFGEDQGGITKAVGALLPTVLGGLVNKSTDSAGFSSIFNMLADNKNAGFLDNLPGLLGGGNLAQGDPKDIAGRLMSNLFGGKVGGILDAVTGLAGVKRSTTSSLLGLVGPIVMGYFSKKIKTEGLNAAGLASFFSKEKSSIMSAIPGALSSTLGFSGISDSVKHEVAEAKSGMGWLWPLLLGLIAIGGIWYFMKGCNKPEMPAAPDVSAVVDTIASKTQAAVDTTKAAVTEAVGDLGAFFKKKLACGVELSIPERGVESRVVAFIEDAGKPVDKTTWHDFDRLTFETGKSTLDMAKSEEQLKNIAEILKCYPKVKFKIGGYTDNVGDPKANMKLSQERADNVVKALTGMGVAADRLKGEGYGEQHPVAPNDTDENKAKNRRISLRVSEK